MAPKVVTLVALPPPRSTTPTTAAAVETPGASTPPRVDAHASATRLTPRIRTSGIAQPPSMHRIRGRRRVSTPASTRPATGHQLSEGLVRHGPPELMVLFLRGLPQRTDLAPSSQPHSATQTITAAWEMRVAGPLHRPLPPALAVPKSGIPAASLPLPAIAIRSTIRARATVNLVLRHWIEI